MSDKIESRATSNNGRASVIRALVIAAVQVGGALLLSLASKRGMIDKDIATRGVMVLIGLGVAAYGNTMPKLLDGPPPPSLATAALRQAVTRTGGWAMMLAGVAYAAVWAFAPRDVAQVGGLVAVGAGLAAMIGNFAWRVFTYERARYSCRHPG
jgi:hypothetical protein